MVSFVLSSPHNPTTGLVSVWDNGCGMTKKELSEWAVMNLSMEDRGSQPIEQAVQRGDKQGLGASRFLTGNLSYFGVRQFVKASKACNRATQALLSEYQAFAMIFQGFCILTSAIIFCTGGVKKCSLLPGQANQGYDQPCQQQICA